MTGRFLTPDGRPLSGQVVFRAPSLLTFSAYDVILGGPVTVPLDPTGACEITLPATDAPGMSPRNWSYTVAEQFAGVALNRTYQILLPAEAPAVDLADLAPTDPTTPNYVAVRGDSAYEVALAAGFVGTIAQWLASLVGPTGQTGAQGAQGAPGTPGDDAYEVAVAAGYSGTRAQWLASLVGPTGQTGATGQQGPPGTNGANGAPGVVQSVNGQSLAAVVLDAADVGAVPNTAPGAPNGLAQLDATGKVPAAQLPAGGGAVTSVNGRTGVVVLTAADVGASPTGHTHTAADVGALATTARGAANGVASLDATSRLPVAQMPAAAAKNVWTPQALGFQAWSCDPAHVSNPTTLKAAVVQRIYMSGINITEPTQVNRVVMFARGWAGSTAVPAARFYAGIYNETGSRLATSGLVSSLPPAGQLTGTAPGAFDNHIGAVPVTLTSTTTLQPGRYWAAFLLSAGSATDFYYMHTQNESPSAPANFFMGTAFHRAWCINTQTSLPATANQSTGEVGLDPAIMALAMV
ncbi:collagen-like protein [Streptomyces sp. NPDC029004]|uniref:collagen-like triple helix repeat-containing protein n=1 Tax=Streptomyces sp. NPDC029004 TaxID=3154490 RepID=UPI0033ECE068